MSKEIKEMVQGFQKRLTELKGRINLRAAGLRVDDGYRAAIKRVHELKDLGKKVQARIDQIASLGKAGIDKAKVEIEQVLKKIEDGIGGQTPAAPAKTSKSDKEDKDTKSAKVDKAPKAKDKEKSKGYPDIPVPGQTPDKPKHEVFKAPPPEGIPTGEPDVKKEGG